MPETTLGSIEFMIRADSMKTSFEDAVKKALRGQNINLNVSEIENTIQNSLQKVEISDKHIKQIQDGVKDILKKENFNIDFQEIESLLEQYKLDEDIVDQIKDAINIDHIKNTVDEIRNDLLIRLRTTLSPENEASALLNLRAEIETAKEEKTKKRLTKALETSEVGKNMVPTGMEAEEFAEIYQQRYLEVMSQFLKSGSWRSNIRKIKNWRGMFEDFLSGTQRFRGKELFKQMTGETEYEKELRETLKSEYGIETLPQKTWSGLRKDIEKGNKKTIKTTNDTLDALEEIAKKIMEEKKLDKKDFKNAMTDIFGTKEVRGEGLAKDIINEFWNTYNVEKGTKILPRPLMKALGKEEQEEFFYPRTLLGRRFDLPQYISKESITEGGWRELFEEQDMGEMAEKIKEEIKERDIPGVMTFGVLKTLFEASTMKKRERQTAIEEDSWRLQAYGMGGKAIAITKEGEEIPSTKKIKDILSKEMSENFNNLLDTLSIYLRKVKTGQTTKDQIETLQQQLNQLKGNDIP